MIEAFLLGVIATTSFAAATFFLKFWKRSHDTFFLAFVLYFLAEGAIRIVLLFFAHPNEGKAWIYVIRLVALVVILAAILRKNYGSTMRQ